MRRFLIKILSLCLLISCMVKTDLHAEDMIFNVINTSDNTVLGSYETYSDAYSDLTLMKKNNATISYGITKEDKLIQCDNAVARLSGYFTFKEVDSGRDGYGTGASAADAAYISTSLDGNTIRIKLAGQVMDIPESALLTLEDPSKSNVISYYINSNGYMMHYVYSYSSNGNTTINGIRVGMNYSYFADNTKYYSYDGHYFYTNYNTMLSDYRNNINSHAINTGKPYYNYFQYLPQRALTSVTAKEIDDYIVSKIGSTANSVMYGTGINFVEEGKKYTINGLLMFGLALYESGYGRSNYALNNNNLFGHGAYDHTASATSYESVDECIAYHAYNFLSCGYLNAADSRYRGTHTGDKQSGINVKYASTPYWGENVACIGYYLGNDYGKYTIGIVSGDIKVYNSPSSSSTVLYSTGATGTSNAVNNVPVIILDTVKGSDGNNYYKIMCDTALNESRSKIEPNNIYDVNRDYGYMLASQVYKVDTGSVSITPPVVEPEEPAIPTNYNPQGHIDVLTSSTTGKLSVSGWAFDKDVSSESIGIKIYSDSQLVSTLTANQARPDVNGVYGISGSHGFGTTLSLTPGSHAISIYMVDIGTNKEVLLLTKNIEILSSDVTIKSYNLILSGQLGLKVYVTLTDAAKVAGSYIEFDINGKKQTVPYEKATIASDGSYVFTCYVTSIEMADNISITYHYGSKVSTPKIMTVNKYIQYIISNPGSFKAEMVELAKAISDYGYYAQKLFSKTKGWTMGVEHKTMPMYKELPTTMDLSQYRATLKQLASGMKISGYSLLLDAETMMKIVIDAGSYSGTPTFKIDGETVSASYDAMNKQYTIQTKGIPAHLIGEPFNVSVDGVVIGKVTPLSYANQVMKLTGNEELKQSMIAFYNYYQATMNYKNA